MNRLLKLSMAFLCVLLAFQPATAQKWRILPQRLPRRLDGSMDILAKALLYSVRNRCHASRLQGSLGMELWVGTVVPLL